jgi:hypothetical protein
MEHERWLALKPAISADTVLQRRGVARAEGTAGVDVQSRDFMGLNSPKSTFRDPAASIIHSCKAIPGVSPLPSELAATVIGAPPAGNGRIAGAPA